MSELVINPIEHKNQRVLTTTQLAKGIRDRFTNYCE